jgi:transposase
MDELLPLIPHGASIISHNLSVIRGEDNWIYFHGTLPIFSHHPSDNRAFRMISSSLIVMGVCRNVDIERVFNVSKSSVIRNRQKYESGGSDAFYKPRAKKKKKGRVLTAEKLEKAKELLSSNFSRSETADRLGVKYDTLSKAIRAGRIEIELQEKDEVPTDKSSRSIIDYGAGSDIGVGCTRVLERRLAALGFLNVAESRFEHCNDVSNGGVLCALPALAANGLYHKINECFDEFKGYYSVIHIITLLAFMALCRIKTTEQLRWQPPGELGKLLGLDRIPEVRCLRNKLSALSGEGAVKWGELLSKKWMDDYPDLAGVLYVDGHVRLYGGKEKLPKQYVSRERLCLRGVMDFWINDMRGQPFFVVRTIVNPGMLQVLRDEIVPRLLKEVPNQPTDQMLLDNPYLHRFIIVFDREGYSPEFFKDMWEDHRIACITYHKYPKDDWKECEFEETSVELINGEKTPMKLAERGSYLGVKEKGLWMKELRKLTKSGHQTSIITTAFSLSNMVIAVLMFARWCQENFLGYMMQHFAIDLLSDYLKEEVPDTEKVISPKWRTLEKKINSLNGKLKHRKSRFADFTLNPMVENGTKKYKEWEKGKSELAEEIHIFEANLRVLKDEQKNIDKHVKIKDLPEKDQFRAISPSKKHLIDTIKMIAYRTETAMANLIVQRHGTLDQARALIRDIFASEADLIPDEENKIITIRIHNLSTRSMDSKLDYLLSILNDARMKYPGTNMLLRYVRLGT